MSELTCLKVSRAEERKDFLIYELKSAHIFCDSCPDRKLYQSSQEVDITQPSLSHAISNLEKELQVPLFERHGRNVTMTKYGEMFLKYVQDSLHILNLGVERIQEAARIPGGSISIGYIHTQGRRFTRSLSGGSLMNRRGRRLISVFRMQLPESDPGSEGREIRCDFLFPGRGREGDQLCAGVRRKTGGCSA